MSEIDQSIVQMMEVLNPRRKTGMVNDFKSPQCKRRLSDSCSETPDKRNKSENSLDVSWVSSPHESWRLRNDVIAARKTINDLESRIQHMHGVQKEMQVMFDNEIKSLSFQHEQDKKIIEELEKDTQNLRKRERNAKREVDEMNHILQQNKLDYQSHIEELEFKINELEMQVETYETAENEQLSTIQIEKNDLTEALEKAERESELYKELVNDLKSRIGKFTNINCELEIKEQMLQTANLKIKDLEFTIESYGEWQIQSKVS